MSFQEIPIRQNGQVFLYSWFNSLRSAGVLLEQFIGEDYIPNQEFSLANNQSSAANVTGLLLDKDDYQLALIYVGVKRSTDSVEVMSGGILTAVYRTLTNTWELLDQLNGDDDGVTFSITSGGQVQYTSDNMSGTGYAGTMQFRAMTFGF
jgi:hypothetical protein